MPILLGFVKFGVYTAMFLTLAAAVAVVLLPRIFHAALALVAVLIGVAGIFLALHADFLAVVQILLYVGAVMTLIIFAVMLTEKLGPKPARQTNGLVFPAALGGIMFFVILARLITETSWNVQRNPELRNVSTFDLGKALMGTYVFPFEVISVVLIVVLVGALVIARKDQP